MVAVRGGGRISLLYLLELLSFKPRGSITYLQKNKNLIKNPMGPVPSVRVSGTEAWE